MSRVLKHALHFANFEITEMNYSSKCLGGGCDDLKVRTLRGDVLKTYKRVQGDGIQNSMK